MITKIKTKQEQWPTKYKAKKNEPLHKARHKRKTKYQTNRIKRKH